MYGWNLSWDAFRPVVLLAAWLIPFVGLSFRCLTEYEEEQDTRLLVLAVRAVPCPLQDTD
jgi:hypothetical protein